jgi:hypothetical protein
VLGLWSGCKEHPRSAPAIFLLLISVVRQQEWHLIWLSGSIQPPSVSLGFPDAVCAASVLYSQAHLFSQANRQPVISCYACSFWLRVLGLHEGSTQGFIFVALACGLLLLVPHSLGFALCARHGPARSPVPVLRSSSCFSFVVRIGVLCSTSLISRHSAFARLLLIFWSHESVVPVSQVPFFSCSLSHRVARMTIPCRSLARTQWHSFLDGQEQKHRLLLKFSFISLKVSIFV